MGLLCFLSPQTLRSCETILVDEPAPVDNASLQNTDQPCLVKIRIGNVVVVCTEIRAAGDELDVEVEVVVLQLWRM